MEPNPDGNKAGRWGLPEGWQVAQGVDLEADDPALTASGRRFCVALTRAGDRCSAPAIRTEITCSAHAGRLDASAGGRTRARTLALVRETAENRMIEARMGARAIIAARCIERASDIRAAFDVVLDNTLAGDKQQAKTLLGFLTAAFPDAQPGNSRGSTEGAEQLTTLSTEQLRALAFTPPGQQ